MFIRCNNCGWEQDDFWSIGGDSPFDDNTIKSLQSVLEKGLKGEKIEIDIIFAKDKQIEYEEIDGRAYVDFKEIIILDLERIKGIVLNMIWPTHESFKNDPNKECPQCGSSEDWNIE
ncbi:MAG TPA: hypothetical protein VMX17_10785 [Candidatus Glassbacteria bacterium]|nr:hypothetical protein [Candidatus Glassbacteria bacterium]